MSFRELVGIFKSSFLASRNPFGLRNMDSRVRGNDEPMARAPLEGGHDDDAVSRSRTWRTATSSRHVTAGGHLDH
jgi:hypothetical protein